MSAPCSTPGSSSDSQQPQQQPSSCDEVTSRPRLPLRTPSPGCSTVTVNQESSLTSPSSYSSLYEKTAANIRRLQESVSPSNPVSTTSSVTRGNNTTTVWVGNSQVIPDNVQLSPQSPLASPVLQSQAQFFVVAPAASSSSSSSAAKKSTPPPPTLRDSPVVASTSSSSTLLLLPCISPTLTSAFNALVTINPHWQSTKKSVRERNSVMCNNALMADVYFNVGGGQLEAAGEVKKFPAHKYILAVGSTVFYAMFYGGLASAVPSLDETIEVPDVEPAAFMAMLRYLYCDEVALDNDNVLATLYCAKKYIVPHLAEECVRFLEHSLSARNACVLLSQSRLFEEPALMERSWEVIDAQSSLALMSDCLADVDLETLKEVLARETLNCRETVVFRAAVNWAAAECRRRGCVRPDDPSSLRETLGSAISLVRFPAMTVQEFADDVAESGLLSLAEVKDVFLHFTSSRRKPDLAYVDRPRRGLQIQSCHRFQSAAYRSNQWRYRGRCDSIQFGVDRRVFVVGFGLYGSSNGGSDYTARIELKGSTSTVLAESCSKFFSDGSSNTFKVFFDQPVQVEPDYFYTASVVLDGAELSYFGQEGMSEVAVGSVTFQFQCSADSTNGTGVQGGQIPELLFYGPSSSSAAAINETGSLDATK